MVGIHAERFARWLAQVHRAHGYDDYRALLEYILRTSTEDGLVEMIIAYTDEELLESATSVADKLEARGRVKGRAEGSAALLLRLLEHRFGPLPHQLEVRVLSADEARIEAWAMRVLDAATLDEVFAEP